MGVEDCATWVCEQVHMECWGEGLGTVLVEWSAQEKSVGVMGVLAGKTVRMFVRLVRAGDVKLRNVPVGIMDIAHGDVGRGVRYCSGEVRVYEEWPGNDIQFTASKPQTLEEAINITQRLMDQVTKHNFVQGTNNQKRKFDDSKNTDNNNYPNDRNNENHYHNRNNNNYQNNCDNNYNNRYNDHHQQQNRRQEAIRAYTVNPTKNSWFATRWITRPSTVKTKDQPLEITKMKLNPNSQKENGTPASKYLHLFPNNTTLSSN
nr:hypothetical protein [Tanacetum cinerariifolium]